LTLDQPALTDNSGQGKGTMLDTASGSGLVSGARVFIRYNSCFIFDEQPDERPHSSLGADPCVDCCRKILCRPLEAGLQGHTNDDSEIHAAK